MGKILITALFIIFVPFRRSPREGVATCALALTISPTFSQLFFLQMTCLWPFPPPRLSDSLNFEMISNWVTTILKSDSFFFFCQVENFSSCEGGKWWKVQVEKLPGKTAVSAVFLEFPPSLKSRSGVLGRNLGKTTQLCVCEAAAGDWKFNPVLVGALRTKSLRFAAYAEGWTLN